MRWKSAARWSCFSSPLNRPTGWWRSWRTGPSCCTWWVEITFICNHNNWNVNHNWFDLSSPPPQYLHQLFKRDHHKGQKYHGRQIVLYAEYDRPNLLPFLRDSTHCPLEKVPFLHVILLRFQVCGLSDVVSSFLVRLSRFVSRGTLWRRLSSCSVSVS